jgi:hypothetical protein
MRRFYNSTALLTNKAVLLLRSGPSTPDPGAAFFPTSLTCADGEGVYLGSPQNNKLFPSIVLALLKLKMILGFWMRLAALPKSRAVFFYTLMAIFQSRSQSSG